MLSRAPCILAASVVSFAASAALAAPQCHWSTEDDYQLGTTTSDEAYAIDVTEHGTVYVAGSAGDGTTGHWIVRKRHHQHGNWSTVDDFVYSATMRSHPQSITHTSRRDIFVAGGSNLVSNNSGHWLVRRSLNAGGNWSTVDDFADPTAPAGWAFGITNSNGQLYVAGNQNVAGSDYNWYVRTSADNGTTWSTDDQLGATRSALAIGSDAGSIVASGGWWSGLKNHWIVRKRVGLTWTTIDDITPLPETSGNNFGAWPTAVAVEAANTFYVAGTIVPVGSAGGHWSVRKTTNGGTSWSVSDDFFGTNTNCNVSGMTIAGNGEIFVVGTCSTSGAYHWITRASSNGGTTWSTVDDYQLKTGEKAGANAVKAAPNGSIWVVGVASDGTRNHWIVRECR